MAKKKDKKPKTTGFVKNLASSVKSAAKDSAKELMPNLSAAVKTNTSVIKNAYIDTQIKFSETDIKQSYLFKSGENLIKNAKADLKSGNIYNKKRMEENTDDPFAKLLNFNFDDPDNDTFNTADDKEPTPSLNLDADSKNDIKTMANFTVAQTKITNRGMAMMTTQLGSISKFHNKNTIKFYEMVEDRLGKIDQNLNIIGGYYKDLVENAKKSTGSESKKPSLNIAYEMGGFDLSEYFEVYRKNAEDLLSAGSMLGSMMIKPMITDFVNNPIGSLLKMGMKGTVPKGVRKSLQDIDRTIGALPILLQGKVPAMKQKGGIWGLLGEVLDLDKNRTKADKNKFVKGPISFDGVTKRAITHVIPGYLRRILVAITKNDKDDLVYDMDMGKFVQASDARKNFRNEIKEARRSAVDGNIDRLEEKYIKELKRRKIISSDEEGSKYLEELRESLSTLGSKGKTLASDFNASDLSKNKKTAKILTEIISNLDSAEFQETNQAMVDAYLNYDNKLKELKDKEIWSSVNDKGGYKSPKKKKDDSIMGRFDNLADAIEDIGEKGKKNFINKIKNKNLREGLGWIVDDDEHGAEQASG